MRAPEHEGVDVCGLEWFEVFLGNRKQLGAAGHPGLDKLDESWARASKQLQFGCRGEGVLVCQRVDRSDGADHTDPPVLGLAHRRAYGWLNHLHHRYPVATGEPLPSITQHCRGGRIAGNHEYLYALGDEPVHHRERVLANLCDRLRAVGRVGSVSDVDDRLAGQLVDDGAGHGKAANATVEDPDRRVTHDSKPTVLVPVAPLARLAVMSSALYTDRYELTMLDAALRSGRHDRDSVFEVFARRLPDGRRFGVVAGTGRLLELIQNFRFGATELAWLRDQKVVSDDALAWLADYRFRGSISGYREGELYFPGSPILIVEGSFAEAVVLETLILSVLNYDSAVASAAARMRAAADGRPLVEMGSRRTGEHAAVAAARAAFIVGFAATSNLEAGRRWGVPTMGTAAHSFTLLHDTEREAFEAQVAALGSSTTLLVDTYDVHAAVALAVEVAGTDLGAVRLDSGDLPTLVAAVRDQLDSLGATETRITVTNDLDEYTIAALRAAPVDSFGVGTSVVTGSGHPAAGFVYKLVARTDDDGQWVSVAKKSPDKASVGGRKFAARTLTDAGRADSEEITVGPRAATARARDLLVDFVTDGTTLPTFLGSAGTASARAHHEIAIRELSDAAFRLSKGEPAIPTVFV